MTSPTQRRPGLLLSMGPGIADRLLDARHRTRLAALARVDPRLVAHEWADPPPEVAAALADAEVLLTCWGAPPLTERVLDAAPRLRAVVHAAGSVKEHITDACWRRGLAVSSAARVNALPVAEYTLAAILFANKRVLHSAHRYRTLRAPHDCHRELSGAATTAGPSASSAPPASAVASSSCCARSTCAFCCTTRMSTRPRPTGWARRRSPSAPCAQTATSSPCTPPSYPPPTTCSEPANWP